ncbi:type I restriction endonuclease subunit R [Ottowia sp.]|uniref:type I restriction endonuclease subunit R n=1 Tax=Ottowia sp. TaxID=1898956 RepID=UPI002CBFAA32|nr:type I restriction endonuclease subunit R [Ottowia sp.]HRN77539.1 type I restriction endonuclease subunit R [Ottowia sp.]
MTEAQLEAETLDTLAELGYTHRLGPDIAHDGPAPERANYREVVLEQRLREAVDRLNPHLPASAREDAVRQVLDLGQPVMISANRAFHKLLVGGVPVQYQQDGDTRGDFARLIDWQNQPGANECWAVSQFSVRGPHHTQRPDIVLFINGLPLVVIELKNPADVNADLWMAFNQVQTYKTKIPDLFEYNELLVISDGTEARMGSITADKERFSRWRTIDGETLDPFGPFAGQETLSRGLLEPARLLDYLRYFVLFEDDGKQVFRKLAGYHQYHAVLAAVQQVLLASRPEADSDQRGRGGVVWHTQGSGKSITMTCFAARVMQEPAMANPTIVVITDRNDLDGQLLGVFGMAHDLLRTVPAQATTRQQLRALLKDRPSGGIIFSTIQKFMPGEDEDLFPLLSDRRNIVVIADEAHRTQYGFDAKLKGKDGEESYQVGYAQHLRDALPNATFVAFTGTPVSGADRDTRAVFGDYLHIYDMQQAQEDGATVPIYYESRLAKLRLKQEDLSGLDEAVDELTEGEEESAQARLKSRWAALERVVGADDRIKAVAKDIVEHYEERCQAIEGKAMIVGMSRDICVRLYDAITALRPDWHDPDPAKGAIKIVMTGSASDKPLLQPHIYGTAVKKELEKRFKDAKDGLRLVIVRDMWLTGFDAPSVHTMYVDKPMQGHNLMQAIARVNRVFKDKPGGLVVDYIGIGNELRAALREYTASRGRGRPTIDVHEAFAIVKEKLDVLRAMLHGFDYTAFRTGGHKVLAGAANHILSLRAGKDEPADTPKRRFADNALALSKAFSLSNTLEEAKSVRDEVAFMQALKVILTKRDISKARQSAAEQDEAIRRIIGQAVVSDEVVDVFNVAGLDKPNIGILSEEFLNQVKALPEKNLAVELLERLMEGEIKTRMATQLTQQRKFSEMLAEVIARYQNRSIETAQVIEELIKMAKEFHAAANRGQRLGLSDDELAFYDALIANESAVRELGDDILKKIAHELTEGLRNSLSVDWSQRESVRARLRLLVRRVLRKYKYPPDAQEAAVELVLEQAEALGEAWAV